MSDYDTDMITRPEIEIFYKVSYSKENIQLSKSYGLRWNPNEKLWSYKTKYNGTDEELKDVYEKIPHFEFDIVKINCNNDKHKQKLFEEILKVKKPEEQNKVKKVKKVKKEPKIYNSGTGLCDYCKHLRLCKDEIEEIKNKGYVFNDEPCNDCKRQQQLSKYI